MKIKFDRYVYYEESFSFCVKGEPWNCALIRMYLDNKYIAFYVKREILFTTKFKQIYRRAKQKMLDKQE